MTPYPKRTKELRVATQAAKTAGVIVRKQFGKKQHITQKEAHELVTTSDLAAQSVIINILSNTVPSYKIISEEKANRELTASPTWVIDPLDGTHNFIFGIPLMGISIALIEDYKRVLGIIYAPIEKNLYSAVLGHGAFRNGKRLRVSEEKHLAQATIAYDNRFRNDDSAFARYAHIVRATFTTRILGSATRDLCFIAEGVLGGRIFSNAKLCDIAAGTLIVEEAGGAVTDFQGNTLDAHTTEIVASNTALHSQLLKILSETTK